MNYENYETQKNKRRIKNKIFHYITERNPNGVLLDNIQNSFPELSLKQISEVLNELESDGLIEVKDIPNKRIPGRHRIIIGVKDITQYPIRDVIQVGGRIIPRLMHGDLVGAEDWNSSFETIAEYVNEIENRFKKEIDRTTKDFWKSLIAIFSVMLSIFSLIIKTTSVNSTSTIEYLSFKNLILINFAQVIPLFIVLLIFLIFMTVIFHEKASKHE